MGFEVPPTRVSRRSSAPILAGIAMTAGLLLVAGVLAGQHRGLPSAVTRPPGTAIIAIPSPAVRAVPAGVPAVASSGRKALVPAGIVTGGGAPAVSGPAISAAIVQCHTLASPDCLRVARSATGLLSVGSLDRDAPGIVGVEVWGSLLCGDNLECPPGRLLRLDPLGSAAVSLAGRAGLVLVDVGARAAGPGEAAARRPLEAWIVQWFH